MTYYKTVFGLYSFSYIFWIGFVEVFEGIELIYTSIAANSWLVNVERFMAGKPSHPLLVNAYRCQRFTVFN
jgi:hypothetical protein